MGDDGTNDVRSYSKWLLQEVAAWQGASVTWTAPYYLNHRSTINDFVKGSTDIRESPMVLPCRRFCDSALPDSDILRFVFQTLVLTSTGETLVECAAKLLAWAPLRSSCSQGKKLHWDIAATWAAELQLEADDSELSRTISEHLLRWLCEASLQVILRLPKYSS